MRQIIQASAILRSGGLVAFPTETVYGLGADATNRAAVARIFAAKGRPSTNPLIVHVPDAAAARRYAREWPDAAQALAERFWPGPLTLVLRKSDSIVHEATAGRDTVGLRAPDHPLAMQLLRVCELPIAGPSANKSNHVSPTTADHVRGEFAGGEVDMVLEGGPCAVGIESTVLDLSGVGRPIILRPGGVSRDQIEHLVGAVDLFTGVIDPAQPAASPGQHERHYAPRTPAYRFDRAQLDAVLAAAQDPNRPPAAIVFVAPVPHAAYRVRFHGLGEAPANPAEYARGLYQMLRMLDEAKPDRIYIELPPDAPEWTAVRDRLLRATRPFA